ncbi:MAG: hypothetical protein LBG08_07445 [Spirochaetaceae bacterium]|nr:hypothetical protein [Spirochaetaceae bacterium]
MGTCGIDDYIYLAPIPRDTILVDLNNKVTIPLPSQSGASASYFRNYEIYYRIYVSGRMELGTIEEGLLSSISTSLYSDYSAMQPYTNVETSTATNVGTVLSNLKYFPLDFEDTNYELRQNYTVTLDFSPTSVPEPSIIDPSRQSPLVRSSLVTNPAPNNRYFLNNADLNSNANAVATRNADVQGNTAITAERYTYVALYIVATGRDSNYSPIFSKPTFVGVFLLPDGTR